MRYKILDQNGLNFLTSRSLDAMNQVVNDYGDDYSTSYTYDPNGNLKTLKRSAVAEGNLPRVIDNLAYNYDLTHTNQLTHVDNAISYDRNILSSSAPSYGLEKYQQSVLENFPDQSPYYDDDPFDDLEEVYDDPGHYQYDGAGNLIATQGKKGAWPTFFDEDISKLSWTPYGKVHQVTFRGDLRKPYDEFDTGYSDFHVDDNSVDQVYNHQRFIYYGYDAAQNRVKKQNQVRVYFPNGSSGCYCLYVGEPLTEIADRITYYIRDAQGNILATYYKDKIQDYDIFEVGIGDCAHEDQIDIKDKFYLQEHHIYGSSRLGITERNTLLRDYTIEGCGTTIDNETLIEIADVPEFQASKKLLLGLKRYECTNHLGNVLAVVSDRKRGIDDNNDQLGLLDRYEPLLVTAQDYYPFGLEMYKRSYQRNNYRFGFNGKEGDKNREWGRRTNYDYGFRIYDPGIGRFLSVDPLTASYPSWTPYAFAMNRVIDGVDLDGLEYLDADESLYEISTGKINLKIENFDVSTKGNFKMANSDPSNWPPGQIGIPTSFAQFRYGFSEISQASRLASSWHHLDRGQIKTTSNIRIRSKILTVQGVEPFFIQYNTNSGNPHIWKKHQYTIEGVSPQAKGVARGMLLVEALKMGLAARDQWVSWKTDKILEDQLSALNKSTNDLNKALLTAGYIDDKFRNEFDLSIIHNYLLQGPDEATFLFKDGNLDFYSPYILFPEHYQAAMKIANEISGTVDITESVYSAGSPRLGGRKGSSQYEHYSTYQDAVYRTHYKRKSK